MNAPKPEAAVTAPVTELRSLDDDVATYLEVSEKMEEYGAQLAAIRHRLADRVLAAVDGDRGTLKTSNGLISVTVSPPNKVFNGERAWGMLTAAQQKLCMSRDLSKVREQLPPVLAKQCYDPGTGTPRVTVK